VVSIYFLEELTSEVKILYDSTTRADGSRSGYVKTILLISIMLFPKYFIITKSGTHNNIN